MMNGSGSVSPLAQEIALKLAPKRTLTPIGRFLSSHAIGARIEAFEYTGVIVGVHFTESKVTYDIDLDVGGETLRNVDSTFVKPE